MYKKNDFRCLKPKDGVPIEQWPHYEMHGYRAAMTEEELSQVQEIPFDKNFFNFEDPEVLNSFTDGSDNSINLWKETYGFDWGVWRTGIGSGWCTVLFNVSENVKGGAKSMKTFQHCLQAEFDSYAQECKKNGGFFKCCCSGFRLDTFHLIRYELKKRNLIRRGPQILNCGEHFEERDQETCWMSRQGFCLFDLGNAFIES